MNPFGVGARPSCCRNSAAHAGGDFGRGRHRPEDLVENRDRGHRARWRWAPSAASGPSTRPRATVALWPVGRTRRRRVPSVRRRRPRSGIRSARGCRPIAGGVESGLGGITLIAQSSDFLLLLAELVLCGGQGRHRCVLAGLSVDDGLVGLLLGQPSRRILVQLLGAGPLQVVHHLLRAGGQRLAGGRGRDHVVGAGRREVAVRRAVDVTGHRETVKSLLGGRDCGVGVFDRLLAGLDVVLRGGRVVARGLDVNHRLVDAFFLGLDLRVEILQTLIGLCHVGDQFGHRVRVGLGQTGCAQQQRHTDHRRTHAMGERGSHSERRAAAVASHTTRVSLAQRGRTASAPAITGSTNKPKASLAP